MQQLLEQALPADEGEDDPLYRAALDVERDERLAAEMAQWDAAIDDGLTPGASTAPRGCPVVPPSLRQCSAAKYGG